jgi:ribosomal protein L40E
MEEYVFLKTICPKCSNYFLSFLPYYLAKQSIIQKSFCSKCSTEKDLYLIPKRR